MFISFGLFLTQFVHRRILDSAEPRRATFNSDGGPAQSPHPSLFPPAFNTTSNLGFNRPSHVEFQSISPGPSMSTSVPVGPGQHVIQFNFDTHGHQSAVHPPTMHPASGPFPAASSEDSPSSSSLNLSPAMSTSSLPNPPSSSTVRGRTFSWRVSSDGPEWSCNCKHQPKKKKRHLESCPSNTNKPSIECPCCSQTFIGGSRESALRKHMRRFHKGFLHLLKKNTD